METSGGESGMARLNGYRTSEWNAACSGCGRGSYITLYEFLAWLYVDRDGKFPDTMLMASVPCRECTTGFVYRSYFCFTCDRWLKGWMIGGKPHGSCSVCNKVLLEFVNDEERLNELKAASVLPRPFRQSVEDVRFERTIMGGLHRH